MYLQNHNNNNINLILKEKCMDHAASATKIKESKLASLLT